MKLDSFLSLPPASFAIKDSDVLVMPDKSADIKRIKAIKQGVVALIISLLLLKPGWIVVEVDAPAKDRE